MISTTHDGEEVSFEFDEILCVQPSMSGKNLLVHLKRRWDPYAFPMGGSAKLMTAIMSALPMVPFNIEQWVRGDIIETIEDRGSYIRFYFEGSPKRFDLFPLSKDQSALSRLADFTRDVKATPGCDVSAWAA